MTLLRRHGPHPHRCKLPGLFERFFTKICPGDVWVCDQCLKTFTFGWDYVNYDGCAEWKADK